MAHADSKLPDWTRMGASLLAPSPEISDYIQRIHSHIAGTKIEGGNEIPAYGLLSLHAQQMPVLAYGSESLKEVYPKSFTDGSAVFVSNDLAREIALEEAASQGAKQGMVPLVLLHEMHALMKHANRLGQFPDEVAQIATEASAYSKLRMGFPEMQWAECVERAIPASSLPHEALNRYSRMPEEIRSAKSQIASTRSRSL